MTIRAPLYTRIERPKSNAWQSFAYQSPNLGILNGQDRYFGAPGQVQDYDYPNPIGKRYAVDLRTWAYSSPQFLLSSVDTVNLPCLTFSDNPVYARSPIGLRTWTNNLLQTTLIGPAAAPFAQYDWPNPKGRTPGISLRTWIDPLKLNLYGQDQLYGLPGQVSDYDYPNPKGRPFPTELRTWAYNLLPNTLSIIQGVPFAQYDWPNPRGKTGAIGLRTWIDPLKTNLLGKDTQFAGPGQFRSYDYPNPKGKAYPQDLRTFISSTQLSTLSIVFPMPFNQYDWPVPKGKLGTVSLRTWIDPVKQQLIGKDVQFAGPGQFKSYDYPNPRGKAYGIELRTFAIASQFIPPPAVPLTVMTPSDRRIVIDSISARITVNGTRIV